MDRSTGHSIVWFNRRRLRPSIRRKLRRIRTSFRLHTRRNVLVLLISTVLILHIISRLGRHRNTVEQRWQRLQQFTRPGIFGAPPDLVLNGPEAVQVQLCNMDGRLCSSWNHDRLWEDDELNRDESWLNPGSIRVPIGVQATLTMKDGQRRILGYGRHQCDAATLDCRGIQRMAVQESIMSAIEKIAEACSGNDWIKEPAIIHTIQPKKKFSKRDVSMIAQFSISRLDRFEHARRVWPGPISVVIFLATNSDIFKLKEYFEQPDKLALYETITLTIVKPDYSQGTHKRYPINSLRNIGIRAASSDYIYVIDADFVPTTRLYSFATTSIIPLLERATMPTAFVVPCLAIKVEYQGQYPDTIEELQPLMKSGMAYITDPRAGHGPTSTSLFMHAPVFGHSPAFEVCFESQWEPYYIVNRNDPHPYYDERFKNQGGDKQSHALLMNAIGYRFMVLRDHFMYHMDHPKLKWTGDGLDQHKQKDFTYFADYLPALENIFGSNFRGAQVVAPPMAPSSIVSLNVLTYNVYLLTELLNWGQNPYQTPTLGNNKRAWNSTTGAYRPLRLMNGGVVIMSKWPIKQQHQFIYKKSCGIDSWANKGFVYVVLDYLGTNVHVFGTHMQNDDKRCRQGQGAQDRAGNLDDMRAYIDARNIPAEELVIIAGDFNINDDSVEYSTSLINRLDVQSADAYVGYGHSFDPMENSLAGTNFPGKQGTSIDFVFVDKSHSQQVQSLVQTLLKVHSPTYNLKGRVFDDFSDHFPVKAVIEMTLPSTLKQQIKEGATVE
ncbi:hypothetical protein EC968_007581 [Mortierella alpina]|nr:hypothetical protein EC968_007581 [Mortierella alpina]